MNVVKVQTLLLGKIKAHNTNGARANCRQLIPAHMWQGGHEHCSGSAAGASSLQERVHSAARGVHAHGCASACGKMLEKHLIKQTQHKCFALQLQSFTAFTQIKQRAGPIPRVTRNTTKTGQQNPTCGSAQAARGPLLRGAVHLQRSWCCWGLAAAQSHPLPWLASGQGEQEFLLGSSLTVLQSPKQSQTLLRC